MLIEPSSYSVGDIITMKLVTSEEVIGKLTEVSDTDFVVAKPLAVMMAQQGFGLVPYILTVSPETPIRFSKTTIVSMGKTLKEVASEYIKQTTGLHI